MDSQELRFKILELAITSHRGWGVGLEAVIKTAKEYEAYICEPHSDKETVVSPDDTLKAKRKR